MIVTPAIFREYDIRGIFPSELNEQCIKLLGYYFGKEVLKNTPNNPYVAVGYDARTHSCTLFRYLTSGLNAVGCKVMGMGMVSTGVNYFSTYQEFDSIKVTSSIMITGSHNPSEYNGFKMTINRKPFFAEEIYKLGGVMSENENMPIKSDETYIKIDVKSLYIDWIVNEFSHLKNMQEKFIIDCGNGVADTVLTTILDKLKLNYNALYCTPDGTFPNHHPDPSEEKNLKDIKNALKGDCEYGFAYDGDADRIAFLTKKHNIKGDIMAILLASVMDKPIVIGEVKCSQIMYDTITSQGGEAIMYKTGHSNLKVKIQETNASFAAEVSGHLFFNDRYFGFDDAIYATFRLLELIYNGMNIDKQIDILPQTYGTDELKINTTDQKKFKILDNIKILLQTPPTNFPNIKDIIYIDGVRVIFKDGWGLIRASNTTPILVTRFESTNKQNAKIYENAINALISKAIDKL
jgi:phosphomannomutase/phosphoglucomutase